MKHNLDSINFNKEQINSFAVLVGTYTEKTKFTFKKPNVKTLVVAIQVWSSRAVFGQDKTIEFHLETPQMEKEELLKIFSNVPSIILYIDGEKMENNALIKSEGNNYYEGTETRMLICNKQTKTKYVGSVKSISEPQPHGEGFLIQLQGPKDQVTYQGTFANGKKEGYGLEKRKHYAYEGQWQNNEKHGYGKEYIAKKKKTVEKSQQGDPSQKSDKDKTEVEPKLEEEDEEEIKEKEEMEQEKVKKEQKKKQQIKEQQLKQLLKHFKSIYMGSFEKGMRSGEGVQYTKYGTYQGNWQAGAKNGQGEMIYKTGAKYEGEWRNNLLEGKGKYIDEAKNVYEGDFEGGFMDGEGVMKYINGDQYNGTWSRGKKHGKGNYTYEDGDYYDGDWVKDSAEGNGEKMVNGVYFQGAFSKGMKHGMGEETNEQGVVTKGIWKKNKLEQVISIDGELVS